MTDRWEYRTRSQTYYDRQEEEPLSEEEARQVRDDFINERNVALALLIRQIMRKSEPGSDEWIEGIDRLNREGWAFVEESLTAQYAAGFGGWDNLTDADRRALREMLMMQRAYWDGFMSAALAGATIKSVDGLVKRANYYNGSGAGFYERGRAASWQLRLPGYPGDGRTICHSNCRCYWMLADYGDRVEATWRTQSGEVCDDCVDRSRRWNPYIVYRPA